MEKKVYTLAPDSCIMIVLACFKDRGLWEDIFIWFVDFSFNFTIRGLT